MRKTFDSESRLKRKYGARMAETVTTHISVLKSASNLAKIPTVRPMRCHQLREDRDEQYAIDTIHPYRLIFRVDQYPIPRDKFGGIDKERVTAIKIMEVIDYH